MAKAEIKEKKVGGERERAARADSPSTDGNRRRKRMSKNGGKA